MRENTAAAAGPSTTFTVDNTAPTVSIGSPSASLTKSGPVTYTITYGGADTISLVAGNVTLNKTNTANGSVAVSGTGTSTRTVTISSITGDGTLGISLAANTAQDTAGNQAAAAGPSTTFTVDNTAPTVSIGSPSASLTSTGPITYTITYGGADNISLVAGNVTLNKTNTANGSVAVSGTGTSTRTVTISSITGDGTLGISLAANTAQDNAGNQAAAAGPSTTFTVENAPSIARISDLWPLANGPAYALTDKTVTGVVGSAFWMEETDRSAAIEVTWTGTMADRGPQCGRDGHARFIERPARARREHGDGQGRCYRGQASGRDREKRGRQGRQRQHSEHHRCKGLYNIAMLVRIAGTAGDSNTADPNNKYFYLDDGSGLVDSGNPGIKVLCGSVTPPSSGNVIVTGLVGVVGGKPVIVIRDSDDIRSL